MRACTLALTCAALLTSVTSCSSGSPPSGSPPAVDASADDASPPLDAGPAFDAGPWGQISVLPALDLAPGLFFTCGRTSSGGVKCWGYNAYGMLGNGTTTDSTTPVDVTNLAGALAVSVSGYNGCALLPSQTVECWGDNFGGELGVTNVSNSSVPMEVPGVANAVQVALGRDFACALLSNRTVTCWGDNSRGALGNGSLGGSPYFMAPAAPVVGLGGVSSISTGYDHACALLVDGTVRCWGDNEALQLGTTAASGDSPVPIAVAGLTGVVAIAAGWADTCALLADHSVMCWGDNSHGNLGNGAALANVTSTATPTKVPGISATAISMHETMCALLVDQTVACWGRSESGTLGNGALGDSAVPVVATGLKNVTGIVTGDTHTCAVIAGGSYACWGDNSKGQLGDGTTTSSPSPVTVTVF